MTEPVRPKELKDWYRLGGPTETSCIEALKRTGAVMKTAAKCGLGQAAPEPLLSSIELFEHEYQALMAKRREEYERFAEKSSDREGTSDSARSIMRRIIPD
jgi:hypothetical protein